MSYRTRALSRRVSFAAVCSSLLISTCLVSPASATTFNVTDQASYDLAVTTANSTAGPHTINITAAGSYNQNVAATFAGDININTAGATVVGTGANEYNTGLRINVASGATFNTGAFTQTIGSLAGAGTVDTDSAAGLLVTGGDNSNTAFSGTITKTGGQFGAILKTGTGTFTINGAQMSEGEFYGTQGTIANTAGSASIKYLAVGTGAGGNSTMTMSGGTLNITGTFVGAAPCASSCPALQVGDFGGTGIFNQTGGTVIIGAAGVAGSMNIGNQGGSGTYNLSGGTLQLGVLGDANSAGLYSIGRSTTNTRNSVGVLNISGTGILDLQAGTFVNGDRDAAGAGATTSSTITQTGGTFRVNAGTQFYLAGADNLNATDSTYNLNGGTLEVGDNSLLAHYAGTTGTYAFNLGGGTIKVVGSALTTAADVNATLTAATMSTINTNGLGATWNGVFSGAGGLNKTGAGTLTLTNNNTYTGATHVIGGTLQGTVSAALSTSTAVTLDSGTTLDISNTSQSIGSLAGTGTVQLGNFGFLVTGNDNTNTSFGGTVLQTAPQTAALAKVGTGTWNISGMTMAEGEFYGIQGTLAQSTGSTHIKYLAVGTGTGNSANMTVSGGTLNITGNYPGSPAICGSNCPALQIGDFAGTGVLTQTAGTVVIGAPGVGASMNIGNQGGNGTYNMSGGTLQLGVFGDVNSAGLYSVGRSTTNTRSSVGNFNISGTALVDVQAGEFINGDRDAAGNLALTSATTTMSGGTMRVRQGANLWLSAFDNGNAIDSTFNLNGGTLEIGDGRLQAGYGGGTGTYVFNLGTATIKVIDADLVTSVHGTLNGASVAAGTTLNTNGFNATWNGVLDGTGWLVKTGAGTLKLEAINTYTGGTALNGGTVFVDTQTDLGAGTAGLSFNGGTLQLGANNVLGNRGGSSVTMAGAGTIDTNGFDTFLDGNITGAGALTKIGAGTLDLGGSNNAHTGAVNVNAGQLNAFNGNAIGDTSAVTVAAGAAFRIYGASPETIGSLAGAGSLLLGANRLVTGGNNSSTTWTGTTDAGTGGITKAGTGTMIVNGNLSYTGQTIVNAGTMRVNGTVADSVVVNSGGTFGGNATINGNLTLNAGGHLAPGNSPGTDHVLGNYVGGGIFDAEVQFNNAGAPVNGTTHDFLRIDGNATGPTTGINVIAFAPSSAPTATTGNGIQLVQVDGNVNANAFALTGPVFQGGYEYLLNYIANYSGISDGFFLQSVQRDELWGHAAMLTAGQAMMDSCFRGQDLMAADGDKRNARGWASVTGGSRNYGADTGVEADQDFFCGSGGVDAKMSDFARVGLSGGYGNSSVDVVTPSGIGTLDGDQGVIEAYVTWSKRHWFVNVSAGYSTTDWSFDSPLSGSSEATVSGAIASAQAGARIDMDNVRLGLIAQIDYDGTQCGETCFVVDTEEEIASLRAKATARLDGYFSDRTIQPFIQVSIEDSLDGANSVQIGTALVESEPGLLLGADVGLTAFVSKNIAIFAQGGLVSGIDKDVDGYKGQGGVKMYW